MHDPAPEPPADSSPPILPTESQPNPFAPPSGGLQTQSAARGFSTRYWICLACILPILGLLCFAAPGLGIPAMCAMVAAAIRVPLMTHWVESSVSPPQAALLLLSSWFISLFIGAASFVAFCTICIPSGFLLFSLDSQGGFAPLLFGGSGIVALLVFVYLFRWSLQLPF